MISLVIGLVACGLVLLAPPTATGDLGEFRVTAAGGDTCYLAGETNTFCFLVTHDPSADEEIMAVDFYFPDGWTGVYACDDNPDHPPGVFALRLDALDIRA